MLGDILKVVILIPLLIFCVINVINFIHSEVYKNKLKKIIKFNEDNAPAEFITSPKKINLYDGFSGNVKYIYTDIEITPSDLDKPYFVSITSPLLNESFHFVVLDSEGYNQFVGSQSNGFVLGNEKYTASVRLTGKNKIRTVANGTLIGEIRSQDELEVKFVYDEELKI